MAPKAPRIGDRVIHHGRPHEIKRFPSRARMVGGKATEVKGVEFHTAIDDSQPAGEMLDRRPVYRVTCILTDDPADPGLQWSPADGAWYMYGRLLARNERAVCEAITGAWPPAASHEAMRDMLDNVDLDEVDRKRLAGVVMHRKADAGVVAPQAGKPDKEGKREPARELTPAEHATLETYAEAALAQVAELRALRLEA